MSNVTHMHHIIPKHAGGTDDPDNLIELSVEEHALAHKALYEQYGRWQDKVAWLSLSGIMQDEERIYEIARNANKGNPTGYTHCKEAREEIRQSKLGEKNPMYGKPAANRGIERPGIGGRRTGTTWSQAERDTRMARMQTPGYFDYTQTPEFSKAVSDAKRGCKGSAKGKTWFTNGEIETYAFECPAGFKKGRKPGRISNKKGMRWYNNGSENRQFRDNEIPEGFVRGRLNRK